MTYSNSTSAFRIRAAIIFAVSAVLLVATVAISQSSSFGDQFDNIPRIAVGADESASPSSPQHPPECDELGNIENYMDVHGVDTHVVQTLRTLSKSFGIAYSEGLEHEFVSNAGREMPVADGALYHPARSFKTFAWTKFEKFWRLSYWTGGCRVVCDGANRSHLLDSGNRIECVRDDGLTVAIPNMVHGGMSVRLWVAVMTAIQIETDYAIAQGSLISPAQISAFDEYVQVEAKSGGLLQEQRYMAETVLDNLYRVDANSYSALSADVDGSLIVCNKAADGRVLATGSLIDLWRDGNLIASVKTHPQLVGRYSTAVWEQLIGACCNQTRIDINAGHCKP